MSAAPEATLAGWDELVDRLVDEMATRPGPVTPALVRRVVAAEAERLAAAPVQAYRDVLVARAARRRLTLVRETSTATTTG